VPGDRAQEVDDDMVFGISEKRVVPGFDYVLMSERLDAGKIGDHALLRVAFGSYEFTADSHFDCVTVPVKVPALAVVIGNPMTGVEFEPAGDAHREAGTEKRGL
jgi:hypothetical protein